MTHNIVALIERLEDVKCDREPFTPDHANCICRLTNEAARALEALQVENGRLKAALAPLGALADAIAPDWIPDENYVGGGVTAGQLRKAREALSGAQVESLSHPSPADGPPDIELIIDEAMSMAQLDHTHPVDVRNWLLGKLRPWLSPPSPAPDGWQMVPKEPTPEMVQAFNEACDENGMVLWKYGYKALLAAAPPAPSQATQDNGLTPSTPGVSAIRCADKGGAE